MSKLRDTEEILRTWLEHYKQASEVAPIVQEAYEDVAWARQALDACPPEAANQSTAQIDQWAAAAHEHIATFLPQIPHFDSNTVIQINSVTTSANTAVTAYIYNVGQLGIPSATKWATEQAAAYKALQEGHTRPARVRGLLAKRWPQVLDRFDAAVTAFEQCATNTGSDAASALDMRTVLDAVQGELFDESRSSPGEKMTWDIMATRLAQDPIRQQVLLDQGSIRRTLHNHLSMLAKRRAGCQTPGINAL